MRELHTENVDRIISLAFQIRSTKVKLMCLCLSVNTILEFNFSLSDFQFLRLSPFSMLRSRICTLASPSCVGCIFPPSTQGFFLVQGRWGKQKEALQVPKAELLQIFRVQSFCAFLQDIALQKSIFHGSDAHKNFQGFNISTYKNTVLCEMSLNIMTIIAQLVTAVFQGFKHIMSLSLHKILRNHYYCLDISQITSLVQQTIQNQSVEVIIKYQL